MDALSTRPAVFAARAQGLDLAARVYAEKGAP